MKLVKQPMFIAGVAAMVVSIVIAIVGTVVNPSSSVINKFEKAINKQDSKLLTECFSPTLSVEQVQYASAFANVGSLVASMGITGDVEYEFLIGEAKDLELEGKYDVKNVPCIMVIKANDKVVYMTVSGQNVVEIDGKEYLYTGQE